MMTSASFWPVRIGLDFGRDGNLGADFGTAASTVSATGSSVAGLTSTMIDGVWSSNCGSMVTGLAFTGWRMVTVRAAPATPSADRGIIRRPITLPISCVVGS